MKKKLTVIAVIVAVLALLVTGSLAYFTAKDTATNVFTIGSVKAEIYENNLPTDSDTFDFGTLLPVADDATAADDDHVVGQDFVFGLDSLSSAGSLQSLNVAAGHHNSRLDGWE